MEQQAQNEFNQPKRSQEMEPQSSVISGHTAAMPSQMNPQSPGLKLKIKLPNKDSLRSSADSIPNSSVEESNPLKIKIRKSDLQSPPSSSSPAAPFTSPNSSAQAQRAYQVSLIPFPRTTNQPYFQKACNLSASSQLGEWNEKELAALSDELESMRKSLKDFSTSLQQQLDSLEAWRDSNNYPPITPEPKQQPPQQHVPHGHSTNSEIKKDTPFKPNSAKKNQKRKRKAGSSSDEDATYNANAAESSSDDEIDVADDDALSNTVDTPKFKNNNIQSPQSKNKLAMLIRKKNSQQGTPRTGRPPKNGTTVNRPPPRASAAVAARNRRKTEGYISDEDELNGYGKSTFWADMESYFTFYTEDDVKFCQPQPIDPEDPAFVIPPLGRTFKDGFEEDDEEHEMQRHHQQQQQQLQLLQQHQQQQLQQQQEESDSVEKPVIYGELTQRILAALIEESVLPLAAAAVDDTAMKGVSPTAAADVFMEKEDMSEPSIPLETPPTYDYSRVNVLSLESRIKAELRHLGLLDEGDFDMDFREDDEVCSELRRLQKQLREVIVANNAIKNKLSSKLAEVTPKEEVERSQKEADAHLERTYSKMAKKNKKQKKDK